MSISFSRQCDSWNFVTLNFHYAFRLRFFLFPDFLPLLRPLSFLSISVVQEFYTCCPSATLFSLTLGPDLPWADEPSPGNLRLSTEEVLAPLSLLMPEFSLVYSPPSLSVRLLPVYIAPLPIELLLSLDFGIMFSPGHLRRTIIRPVSYYALFK